MHNSKQHIFEETWEASMVEYIRNTVEAACTPNLGISLTHSGVELPEGQHVHDEYEFMIPISGIPCILIENHIVPVENNTVYTIFPEQYHGINKPVKNARFLNLTIRHNYMNEIARELSGKPALSLKDNHIKFDSNLKIIMKMFMDEGKYKQAGYEYIMESLSNQIIVNLLRSAGKNLCDIESSKSKLTKTNIDSAIHFLKECYSTEFSLSDVAKTVNLSPYHFARVFKAQTGKTTYQYLMEIKIEKAKQLLAVGKVSIKEVCLLCGFNSHSHFTSMFTKFVGVSPTEYRNII